MASPEQPTYWSYLRLEELLSLQNGISPSESEISDDELRFIVIHQIDELWFKLVLRELGTTRDLFELDRVPETSLASGASSLRRTALIFQMAADHFRLMETMRTQDYLEFRDKLSPASGFQSAQLREIEILLGLPDEERLAFGAESSYLQALQQPGGKESPALARVERRRSEPRTLKDTIYAWLARTPINGSSPGDPDDAEVVKTFIEEFLASHESATREHMAETVRVQALTKEDEARLQARYQAEFDQARSYLLSESIEDEAERARTRRLRAAILFIESNRQLPLLSWPGEIMDAVIEAEQSMLVFRQRHARMVERVIGRRVGTGGSAGVDYLDATALRYRIFVEIWAARTLLLRRSAVPAVKNPDFYGLRSS